MPSSNTLKKIRVAAAVIVALFSLYVLLGFFAAPYAVKRVMVNYAAEQLERRLSIREVRVNPLLFRLEMKDVALAEQDGAPIMGFGRLVADFETSSLARWAWTFSEIRLEAPTLALDIGPDGRLNLAVLLGKFPKRPPRPEAKPPRLLLQQVALSHGAISLNDRSGAMPASQTLRPINLELRDISTIPDRQGAYTVSARLEDGGTFRWRGNVSLEPFSSSGEMSVSGVKPLTAWRFLRDELALEQPRGEVDVEVRYRVALEGGKPVVMADDLRITGRDLAITAAGDKEPLLALTSVKVTGGRLDLARREVQLPSLVLRDGAAVAAVNAQGVINWAKLVKAAPRTSAAAPVPAGAAENPWRVKIDSLDLGGIRLQYVDHSRARPVRVDVKDVKMQLNAALEMRPDSPQVALDGIGITLARPSLQYLDGGDEPAAFESIVLDGGRVDLDQRRVAIGRVAVTGGVLQIVRDKAGAVPLIDGLAGRNSGPARPEAGAAVRRAAKEGRPWHVALDAVELSGTQLRLSDLGFADPVVLDVQNLRARARGYQSDGKAPVELDAAFDFAQGGAIAVNGKLRTDGGAVTGRVSVRQFNLKPFAPVLASRMRAVLVSGVLSTDIGIDYRARDGLHELRAAGPVSLDDVRVNEAESGEQLLGWKSLATREIRLGLTPDELRIEEIRLSGLGAKIVVFKDRSLNLAKAASREPDAGAAPQGTGGAPAPAVTAADPDPVFPVTIERVNVESGTVNFSDQSLVLPFAANVTELAGTIQGVSTDRASRAAVRLEGRVDQYGFARVNGSLRPFRPASFLDLGVVFRNIEMPPLSPYTATFAGRRIASGRLDLDLQYKINEGMLAGDNKVVLQNFTLGERVEAPEAKNLPLDLAVALLTDSDGKIDLSLPVSGNVNDPQFSYGHVIWQAISTLIGRIVTAPFRALGAVFGGGENLDSIAFDPARAALLPPEREKLKRLADGLAKRPQLQLVVEGQYGPADRRALQEDDVERAVAARLGRPVAAGAVAEPVNVTDAKTQRALEALFIERHSEPAFQAFVAETGKTRGKPVVRVNAALALLGRASADRDFYEALLKQLIESAPVPDEALKGLAMDRARAVADHLTAMLGTAPARVATRIAAGRPQAKLALEAPQPAAPQTASER